MSLRHPTSRPALRLSQPRRTSRRVRQLVETLELRRLLAAVSWDGGAGTLAWTDANNWSTNALPTIADDVTIDIPAAIVVTIASGIQSVNSLISAEGVTVSGGTLAVADNSGVTGPFTLSGTGTLAGAGTIVLAGASTWTGGTMSGSGSTTVIPGGTLAISGGTNLNLARSFSNQGTINWSGTADLLMTNSTLSNTGTINHSNASSTSAYVNTAGINQLVNAGTINKSGNGVAQVSVPMTINSTGTIAASAGTFTVSNTLTQNGGIGANGSATINFNAPASYAPSSSVSGTGTFLFSAGTHVLEPGRYTPTGVTTIQGTAAVTVNATLAQLNPTLTGGAIFNSPVTINNSNINGTVTFNQPVTFTGTTTLAGNVVANSTTSTTFSALTIGAGTVNLTSAAALTSDALTLNGTLNTPANVALNSTGTFNGGSLLGGGMLTIGSFATLTLNGSSPLAKNVDNDGTIVTGGNGGFAFNGVTLTNDGTVSFNSTGNLANTSGTNQFINNGIVNKGSVNTYGIAVPATNNGPINIGAGTLDFNNTLANNATITVAAGAELELATTTFAAGSNVTGAGNVDFPAGGTNTLDPATFNTTGDLLFTGGTVTLDIPRNFTGNRAIAGNVTFNQPVTFGGTLTVNGGATATFASAASIAGNVSVAGRLNVDTPSPGVTIGNLSLSGAVGGSGLLVVTGAITNASGNMVMDGTGTTRLTSTGTLTAGNTFNLQRVFDNEGVITIGSGNQDITFNNGTLINDNQVNSVNGTGLDQLFNGGGTNLLINNGSINKTVGVAASNLSIEIPIQHNGLINVGVGTVSLSGAGSVYSPASTTAGAGNIVFNGGSHTFQGASTLDGISAGGIAFFSAGTVTFDVDTTLVNARFAGSTVNGAGTISLGNNTEVYGGRFDTTGAARLRVPAGAIAFFNGNNPIVARPFDIVGTLRMPNGGDLNLLNVDITIANTGTLHFNTAAGGSDIEPAPGATSGTLINLGTVLRDVGGSATIGVRFDNRGLVDANGGTLGFAGGFADGTFTTATGVYDVAAATVNFGAAINTNAAEFIFRAGANVSGLGNLQFNDGKLDFRDGVDLSIDPLAAQGNTLFHRGQIELSPGSVLTIPAGNTLQFAGAGNATLRSEIAGPLDTQFGRLVVGGTLRLASPDGGDSQFDPDLVGGYDPAVGTRFNVVTAGAIVDAFDDYFGAVTPSGRFLLAGRTATQAYAEVGTTTPPSAPEILNGTFDFQTREAIVLTFNTDVSAFVSRRDLSLVNRTTGLPVSTDIGLLTYDAGAQTATLTLTNLLPDADYRLTIAADDIANANGVTLSSPLVIDFHVLRGDANRDRAVGFGDLLILAQNYNQTGRTFGQGNVNYSVGGTVDFGDLLLLAQQYNVALPPPLVPIVAGTTPNSASNAARAIVDGSSRRRDRADGFSDVLV